MDGKAEPEPEPEPEQQQQQEYGPEPEPEPEPEQEEEEEEWRPKSDPRLARVVELEESGETESAARLLRTLLASLDPHRTKPKLHAHLAEVKCRCVLGLSCAARLAHPTSTAAAGATREGSGGSWQR